MSGTAVQAALVAALEADAVLADQLSGIFDGPPARCALPYVSIDGGASADWSTKTQRGREIRLAVTVWDGVGNAAQLLDLAERVERAIEAMPRTLAGGRIASLMFLRGRIVRGADAPWAATAEYRVRTLED